MGPMGCCTDMVVAAWSAPEPPPKVRWSLGVGFLEGLDATASGGLLKGAFGPS